MDRQAALADQLDGAAPRGAGKVAKVTIDQAIFTSTRSATGEGYSLAGASAGISGGEKTELTQRSPSHDSLSNTSETAVALSSYRLSTTGRYCVVHSKYAGAEQSARGRRIYSHMVLLDQGHYGQFDNNPVVVHAALVAAVGDLPILKAPARLEPLVLQATDCGSDHWITERPKLQQYNASLVGNILQVLLNRQRLIVLGVREALGLLEWTFLALPVRLAQDVSTTIGLKFSPSRPVQLTFTDQMNSRIRRAIMGQQIEILDTQASHPASETPLSRWVDLIGQWRSRGRFAEISTLTSRMSDKIQATDLQRIAVICGDMDSIRQAKPCTLRNLINKYSAATASSEVESQLTEQLITRAHQQIDSQLTNAADLPPNDQ